MCVIFFYVNSNPSPGGYKLILASNRDEFYHRDTRNCSKWKHLDGHCVYGGIDLEPGREGGTWLAIGEHNGVFKVGALLNLTGEPKPRNAAACNNNIHYHNIDHDHNSFYHHVHDSHSKLSTTENVYSTNHCNSSIVHDNHFLLGRGMIVSDFVTSMDKYTINDYNADLMKDCVKYSAFNFVSIEIGDRTKPSSIKLCSNVPPTLVNYNEGECYGFGNSLPDIPFQKVRYGRDAFEKIVEELHTKQEELRVQQETIDKNEINITLQNELIAKLQNLLKCKQKFWPDNELERRAPNWGEEMSSLNVNVKNHDYGSRTHTIILIDSNNKMNLIEETMATLDPNGEWTQTHIEEQFCMKT